MSIQTLVKTRRQINFLLFIVLIALITILLMSVKTELIKYLSVIDGKSNPNKIIITQKATTGSSITLNYNAEKNYWQLTSPYQQRGSYTVLNALLGRINSSCEGSYAVDSVDSEIFADLQIDNTHYAIGELNPITDKVYVKVSQDDSEIWMLCDKAIAAIALAPAVNFIDRNLYIGNVNSIKGSFGELTINNQLDVPLDVLEIVEVETNKLANSIDSIHITGDNGEVVYQVISNNDGEHLLLTKPQSNEQTNTAPTNTQLVYIIQDNPELLRIIGLESN